MNNKIVDHLFRHQYGKMIAILTNFFGIEHLELIEDAVQDTFIKATLQWRNQLPDNPEAWLTQAAKNRAIDLLRKIKAEKLRGEKITSGAISLQLNELFLDHEVEDSQLRMIFLSCHPALSPEEQIAFSLKTVSGFSMKEIAAALMIKEETIKKRLIRARKTIIEKRIRLDYPGPGQTHQRVGGVLQVIYLIFNEGFHSTKPNQLISKDLCGEALRLCQLLLKKEKFRSGSLYALFALLCFHSARLESKTSLNSEIIDLEHQDRAKWYFPLIALGNESMTKAMEYKDISTYHYEASIAAEHLKARSFEKTNWKEIASLYQQLNKLQPSINHLLNLAIVYLQMDDYMEAKSILDVIKVEELEQRTYLYYGIYAEYFAKTGNRVKAMEAFDKAIELSSNEMERKYLAIKKGLLN